MRSLGFTHLAVIVAATVPKKHAPTEARNCPGNVYIDGYGLTQLIPSNYVSLSTHAMTQIRDGKIAPEPNSRGYFGRACKRGHYDIDQYLTLNLLGHQLSLTVDLNGAGCGCNVAFYLTSMGQNDADVDSECGDYYCDANNICGASCSEIDIMEANQYAWHSTLHDKHDHSGFGMGYGGGGYGWNGPRDWEQLDYGPGGRCVDTDQPFRLETAFPLNEDCKFAGVEVTVWQLGKPCKLNLDLSNYPARGMQELHDALKAGMVPVVSYSSSDNLGWLDGGGSDRKGPCARDAPDKCRSSVTLANFSIHKLDVEKQSCPEQVLTDKPPSLIPTLMPQSKPLSKVTTAVPKPSASVVVTKAHTTQSTLALTPAAAPAQLMQPTPPKLPTQQGIAYTDNDRWLAFLGCLAAAAVFVACIWLVVAIVPALQPQPCALELPPDTLLAREISEVSRVSPTPGRVPNTALQTNRPAPVPVPGSRENPPQQPLHSSEPPLAVEPSDCS